ncbi:hypothetical protein SDC9_134072 [bioreactor metagenome]|uniref:Uncharacterized protein n=1 Tax=bioreactor metagenome TaxID=1076179 RepID=A0A645DCM3_9ZZZZ
MHGFRAAGQQECTQRERQPAPPPACRGTPVPPDRIKNAEYDQSRSRRLKDGTALLKKYRAGKERNQHRRLLNRPDEIVVAVLHRRLNAERAADAGHAAAGDPPQQFGKTLQRLMQRRTGIAQQEKGRRHGEQRIPEQIGEGIAPHPVHHADRHAEDRQAESSGKRRRQGRKHRTIHYDFSCFNPVVRRQNGMIS